MQVGTVEYRSITEPMRAANPLVEYFEAEALQIDTDNKVIRCESRQTARDAEPFRVAYDYLVVSVGMEPSTFGVAGVREHCYFLKEVDDARALRSGAQQSPAFLIKEPCVPYKRALHYPKDTC
jgi:NADH:ubiquinone reductase (non-electrogenic)